MGVRDDRAIGTRRNAPRRAAKHEARRIKRFEITAIEPAPRLKKSAAQFTGFAAVAEPGATLKSRSAAILEFWPGARANLSSLS
jgi:hypothetical protein